MYIYIIYIKKKSFELGRNFKKTTFHYLWGVSEQKKHPRPRPWPSAWSSDSWRHLKTDWPPGKPEENDRLNHQLATGLKRGQLFKFLFIYMLSKQFCCQEMKSNVVQAVLLSKAAVFSDLFCTSSKTTFPAVEKKAQEASGDRRDWTTQKPLCTSCLVTSCVWRLTYSAWRRMMMMILMMMMMMMMVMMMMMMIEWWYVRVLTPAIVKRQNLQGHCTFWALPGQLCQCHGCSLLADLRVTRLLPQNLKVLVHRPGNGCCSLSCLHKCLLLWQLLKLNHEPWLKMEKLWIKHKYNEMTISSKRWKSSQTSLIKPVLHSPTTAFFRTAVRTFQTP